MSIVSPAGDPYWRRSLEQRLPCFISTLTPSRFGISVGGTSLGNPFLSISVHVFSSPTAGWPIAVTVAHRSTVKKNPAAAKRRSATLLAAGGGRESPGLRAFVQGPSPAWCIILLALIAQIVFFLAISRARIIDGDEGSYLLASRLVMDHKLPYIDFFYQQMPALPFVYGSWMKVFGMSWHIGRTLSAIFAAILGSGLFAAVWRDTKRCAAGAFALVLFVTHGDVLGWYVTVKTYALSALLLFAAHQLVTASRWRHATILGGIALGLATDVRLYFAALLPLFVIWLYQERRGQLLHFGSGFLLALLPTLYLVGLNPRAFYFNTLGYHAMRTGRLGLVQDLPQKLRVLSDWVNDFQTAVLLLLGCLFIFLYEAGNEAARLALYLSLVFSGICLLPNPAYAQYFCAALPMLVFATVSGASAALDRLPSIMRTRMVVAYGAVLLLSSPIWSRYYAQYFHGIAPMTVENWRVKRAVEVSHAADEYARPGEPVISTWSGYIFESKAAAFPGMENDSRLAVAEQLGDEDLRRYRVAAERQIAAAIEEGAVRVVIFGHQPSPPGTIPEERYYRLLERSGFRLARRIGDTDIFVRH
jgi:hypothetical protein